MEITPLTIELINGIIDSQQVAHRDVTFGRRLTILDMVYIDADEQSNFQAQKNDMIVRRAITKFGTLPIPVPLNLMLDMPRVDRLDLVRSYNRFMEESAGERQSEFISHDKVKVEFGLIKNEIVYDVATFGNQVTGHDELDAERQGLSGLGETVFLIGKEIAQLSQSDGPHTLEGPFPLELMGQFDAADLPTLRAAEGIWLNSFRRPGATLQGKFTGEANGNSDARTGQTRSGNTVVAD